MTKPATVKEAVTELEAVKAFSDECSLKLLNYPKQGLACNYLHNVSLRIQAVIDKLKGNNQDEQRAIELFRKQQLCLDLDEARGDAEHPE
jgi:hypothetical protein